MKKINVLLYISLLLVSVGGRAADWNVDEAELLAVIKSCWTTTIKEEFLACYHEDFVGWHKNKTNLIAKDFKRSYADDWDWSGTDYDFELTEFTPHSVRIVENTAVAIYTARSATTDKATGEVTVEAQILMDIYAKVDGKWVCVAEYVE